MKDTFIIRSEWWLAIKKLDAEKQANILKNLFAFHMESNFEPEFFGLEDELVWTLIEPNLKRNSAAYDRRSITSSENGKLGGRPPNNPEPNKPTSETYKPNESLSVSVSDTVSVSDSDTVLETETVTEEKKERAFNFRKSLLNYGFKENLVNDWLKVRKTKKATNTETALKKFFKEIEKRDCDINKLLTHCIEKSWGSFSWEWIDNDKNQKNGQVTEQGINDAINKLYD